MTDIAHHIPHHLIRAYASGSLPHVFSVVVAAHVSLCDECRARMLAEEMVGGAVLDRIPGGSVSATARDQVMVALDEPYATPPPMPRSGIFPGPVMTALDGHPPRWRMLGGGIRQQILASDEEGSLRLIYIPPGRAVPEHGHRGLEMTLVLQGSFSDSEGRFATGDVEVAEADLDHTPVADSGSPCICLAATDAPLRFHAFLPRLLQPLFRI